MLHYTSRLFLQDLQRTIKRQCRVVSRDPVGHRAFAKLEDGDEA